MANVQAKLPGYETTFISRVELTDEGLKALQEKVKAIIAEYKGEVVVSEDWGKKKLAYPIEKETRGHYTHLAYTGKPGVVAEIERNLRIHDHVIRFLSVNLAKEFDTDAFIKRKADLLAAAKKREEERESRKEERGDRRGYDRGYGADADFDDYDGADQE